MGPALLPSLALAALAGVLDFVAFPGIGVWPLAFIALIPIFIAVSIRRNGHHHSEARIVVLATTYGLVGNLGGFYWLVNMLENFSGFSAPVCLLFAVIVCLYQGGMLALFVWLWSRATRRGFPSIVVAPAALVSAEFLWPLLFPYYHGAHLHSVPYLVQSAELGGPMLLSALVVVGNVGLLAFGRAVLQRTRLLTPTVLVAAAVLSVAVGFGAIRMEQVRSRMAKSPARTVGIVQVSMGIFAKRSDPVEGLRRHITDSMTLLAQGPLDLLVWPESAFMWFVPETTRNVKDLVMGPVSVPLLFGGLRREAATADSSSRAPAQQRRLYNTAFLTDARGDIVGSYDKTFLMAFGEYIPFGDWFPILYSWSPHSGHFTPGSRLAPLRWGDFRISALICFEDIVPRFTRQVVKEADPHLLVSIANDAWFGESSAPWQHLALAQLRAVEHRRFLVRSTNSGVSAIVDATGAVTHVSGVFAREALRGEVRLMDGWTAYQSVGDWPGWVGCLVMLFTAFRRRRA